MLNRRAHRGALVACILCIVAGIQPRASAPTWTVVGSLSAPRYHHRGFLLGDGRVIVVGEGNKGALGLPATFTTEIFDPVTGAWAFGPAPTLQHDDSEAVRLADGRILVAGGRNGTSPLATSEIFDPATNVWSATGPLNRPRVEHTLTLLPNGRVLAAGGYSDYGFDNTAELFDPAANGGAGAWTFTSSMARGKWMHSATLLDDGRVLIVGGENYYDGNTDNLCYASTELYDPNSAQWNFGPPLSRGRCGHKASRLPDGRVIVVGGIGGPGRYTATPELATTEIFDGATWSLGPSMALGRYFFTLTTLADGSLLATGGTNHSEPSTVTATTEHYDPATNTWTSGAAMNTPRQLHSATLLADGRVLVAGGYDGSVFLSSAEVSSVLAPPPNNPPAFVPPTAADGTAFTVQVGSLFTARVAAQDLDASDRVTISVSGLPSGASSTTDGPANPATTDVQWVPGNADVGMHPIVFTATDDHGAASGPLTINVDVRPPALVSISVEPSTATLNVFQHQQYTATAHFSDGSTQVLQSGSVGGSGGGSPTLQSWWVHFFTGLPAGVCSSPQTSFAWSSQGLRNQNGTVQETWQMLQVAGTMTADSVHLTVGCTDTSLAVASGSIDALWTGTRYQGTFDFVGVHGDLQITGWSRQADLPTRRFALGAAALNGLVYAIGGADAGSVLGTLEAYNPAINAWTTGLPPMPAPREGLGVVALGGHIYAVGGRVADGTASGIVEVFDPVQNSWTTLPQAEWMPTARAHLAVVTDGTFIYALGGDTQAANGGLVATVEKYDPASHNWTSLASMPAAGNFIAAGLLNQTIVVVGSGGNGGPSARTDVYDIAANSWRSGVSMPVQRGLMAAGVANGGLWVIGGAIDGTAPFDTWVYYPQTNTQPEHWTGSGAIPTSRMELAAAVVGDVVYAIGGFAPGGSISLGANESLSTVPFGDWNPGPSIGPSSSAPTVQWQSTNPSVATIDQSGNATALSPGATTILASAGGVQCRVEINECAALTVARSYPAVNLLGSPNPSTYGQTVTFTMTIGGIQGLPAPTGTVTFTIDGTQATEQSLVNGQATFSTNSLAGVVCGTQPCYGHNIVGTYGGDINYEPTSRATSQFVNKAQPSLTLTSSLLPSLYGQAVTFTATVTGPTGVPGPGGTVTFRVDGAGVATESIDPNGVARYTTSTLAVGDRNIAVRYNGDVNFNPDYRSITQRVMPVNHSPDCTAAVPSLSLLWPPNHQWVPIAIEGLTDEDGDAISVSITSIFQDEPTVGVAAGDTAPDGSGIGTSTARVRAERAGKPGAAGNGRVYHISFRATDSRGASCSGTVEVGVPHDWSAVHVLPVDDGPLYNSVNGERRQ